MSKTSGKPRKEAYYVQLMDADRTPMFVNVSSQLGKPLSVTKPIATAVMRIRDDAILFSVLKLYTAARKRLMARPLALPPAPLARLERRISSISEPLTDNDLVVELGDERYQMTMRRDGNGQVTIEHDSEVEVSFELPSHPLQLTIYLRSPRSGRLMVIGWQGYQAKPGSPETLVRSVSQALNHLSSLTEFQVLSDISTVIVPAPPGRYQLVTPTRKASDKVLFQVPVRLWDTDEAGQMIVLGQGEVAVEVDLDNVKQRGAHLLFSQVPAPEIAEAYAPYEATLTQALEAGFMTHFGADELQDLCYSIALGELGPGDIERLREAATTIGSYELNVREFRKVGA